MIELVPKRVVLSVAVFRRVHERTLQLGRPDHPLYGALDNGYLFGLPYAVNESTDESYIEYEPRKVIDVSAFDKNIDGIRDAVQRAWASAGVGVVATDNNS